MIDLEYVKATVAATKGAGLSVEVLLNELTKLLDDTARADGLEPDSQTMQLIQQIRSEAPSFGHLAEIGTRG